VNSQLTRRSRDRDSHQQPSLVATAINCERVPGYPRLSQATSTGNAQLSIVAQRWALADWRIRISWASLPTEDDDACAYKDCIAA